MGAISLGRSRVCIRVAGILLGLPGPLLAVQEGATSPVVLAAARTDTTVRIVISVKAHHLWAVGGQSDTLLSAPAAVGSGRRMSYSKTHWSFATPIGVRTVISKEEDPVWIPPDWHYVETARSEHLRLVWLRGDTTIVLRDGSRLEMRGTSVRLAHDSTFEVFEQDEHIIIDGVLFVPPIGSDNRRVPGELGKYRLAIGDGVGIHGTPDSTSIGRAVSHGCIRLHDTDVEWLYVHLPIGTRVYIY